MGIKKILSWISLLFGETLIIATFILFKGDLTTNILVLNILVSSVIYSLFFMDILVPWIDFDDKSQKKVGSLGIRWFFTSAYSFGAIAGMFIANVAYNWTFPLQIIIQGISLFMLLLGFIAAFHASDKVKEIYELETLNRSGIIEMKSAMSLLKEKIVGLPDLPEYFTKEVTALDENVRFISPANNQDAYDLEQAFAKTVNEVTIALTNFSMNEEAIRTNIKKLEVILLNRKQVYSH